MQQLNDTECECVLLINPEELVLLGLRLAPASTRDYAIGQPAKTWQSLTEFFLDALEDLATSTVIATPSERAVVQSIEARAEQIDIRFEWRGLKRQLVYFLRNPADKWPPEIARVKVVVDVGPQPPALGSYAHRLKPTLAPKAVLLATAEDYNTRIYPFIPQVEKPPMPDAAHELWSVPIYRFRCLRALLEPERCMCDEEVKGEAKMPLDFKPRR